MASYQTVLAMLKLYMDDPSGDQYTPEEYGLFIDQAYRDVVNKISRTPQPWGIAEAHRLDTLPDVREYELPELLSFVEDVVELFDGGTESPPWGSVPFSQRNHARLNGQNKYYVYRNLAVIPDTDEPLFMLGLTQQEPSGGRVLLVRYRMTGSSSARQPSVLNTFQYVPDDHTDVVTTRAAILAKGAQLKDLGSLPARYAEGMRDLNSYLSGFVRRTIPLRAH